MPSRAIPSIVRNKQILLDTGVLFTFLDRSYRYRLFNFLVSLAGAGTRNVLGVSEISRFEILRLEKTTTSERQAIQRMLNKLGIVNLEVSADVITNAATLCRNAFPKAVDDPNFKKNITADMIIGGTVLGDYDDTILMTADRTGFMEPYWKIVGEKYFLKKLKKGRGWAIVNFYFLEFNPCALNDEDMDDDIRARCGGQQVLALG